MWSLGQWTKMAGALAGWQRAGCVAVVALATAGGCSDAASELQDEEEPGQTGGEGATSGPTSVSASSSGSGAGSGENCAEFEAEAQSTVQPADIILAVDQSGSMNQETDWVEQQLNTFAAQITSANIDVHVVVIAAKSGGNSLCVPAPLGSGQCPDDDNPPALVHVDQEVDSHDALEVILATYPAWQGALRAGASKHFVVISDDDAQDVLATDFTVGVNALDPQMFGEWMFHAIVADDGNCDPAADEGVEYKKLVTQTGGVLGDLCLQDFQPVWDQLSTQLVDGSTLACQWAIPAPPEGQTFDPAEVNVDLSTNGGSPSPLGYVEGVDACAGVTGGWHYDDAASPSEIRLCPDTCDLVQSSDDASVKIKFGCATVNAPPQ